MSNATSGSTAPKGLELQLTNVLSGIPKVLPTGSSLVLNGNSMTTAQLTTAVQNALLPFTAARGEKTLYLQKLKAKADSLPAARELLQQIRGAAVAFLGTGSPLLNELGFAPKAKKAQTLGQKTLAAAKRTLTRAKRGTLGSRQKAAIKVVGTPGVQVGADGTLQVTAPTPVSAVSPAAPAVAQSASAPAPAPATVAVTGGSTPVKSP